jgi:hypothetical protein
MVTNCKTRPLGDLLFRNVVFFRISADS